MSAAPREPESEETEQTVPNALSDNEVDDSVSFRKVHLRHHRHHQHHRHQEEEDSDDQI